jgi:hypothetical protein
MMSTSSMCSRTRETTSGEFASASDIGFVMIGRPPRVSSVPLGEGFWYGAPRQGQRMSDDPDPDLARA